MKPPDEVQRDLVRQWLKKGDEDFGVAELLLEERTPYMAAAAFHLQQAAEKDLKALLVRHQVEFPKTHDLGKLLDLLTTVEAPLVDSLETLIELDPYSVAARYPGEPPEVSREEVLKSLELVRSVKSEVRAALASYLGPNEGTGSD